MSTRKPVANKVLAGLAVGVVIGAGVAVVGIFVLTA